MKKILALSLLFILAACGDATKIIPVRYQALEGWQDDQHAAAYKLFIDSCAANVNRANSYQSKVEGPVGEYENWQRTCGLASDNPQANDVAARIFFETNFTPYKVETESKATGLLTGYYEPIINGAREKKAPYLTPVYGTPKDMPKPGPTREEIVAGALEGIAPVLLYVEDPVMLFFLHIQGSGKVRLPDGELIGLQYDGQNGREFFAIGRYLKESGAVEKASMQTIRDWLHSHPERQNEVMNMNPSYIFFRLAPGEEMAKGALGIPLTPMRSVAIDDDRAAYGVPTYIDTLQTEYQTGNQIPLRRLFVSQDTGGALKGPNRGDLFFGRGEIEEWQAGHQAAQGNVYWLLPVGEGVKLNDGLPVEEAPQEQSAPEGEPPTAEEQPIDEPGEATAPDDLNNTQ